MLDSLVEEEETLLPLVNGLALRTSDGAFLHTETGRFLSEGALRVSEPEISAALDALLDAEPLDDEPVGVAFIRQMGNQMTRSIKKSAAASASFFRLAGCRVSRPRAAAWSARGCGVLRMPRPDRRGGCV